MTNPLLAALQVGPELRWVVATVASIQVSEKAVTVTYQGVAIAHVGYLASYAPVVGDKVHCLMQDTIGILILGKQDIGVAASIPAPGAAQTVAPTAANTYSRATQTWTGEQIAQTQGNKQGAWFYSPSTLAALSTMTRAKFEIQVNPSAGSGPLGFVLHSNSTIASPFVPASEVAHVNIAAGTAVWVPLPLSWATALIGGSASGVGLSSDLYSAVVGGGTLRFTPL